MKNTRYKMAFTSGALLHPESVLIAQKYMDTKDWGSIKATNERENFLQTRTVSTGKKICSEIILRLSHLEINELEHLTMADPEEQKHWLWLAICRRYTFISEFASEVMHEHVMSLKPQITYADFDAFFNRKAEWHPELDAITRTTQSKLRQVLFRMLREAGFLNRDNRIIPVFMNPILVQHLVNANKTELLLFPIRTHAVRE